jgi:hypothetical protein
MGFLTTLTIYNDGIHLLEPHAQEFAQEVRRLASGLDGPADVALGYFVNAVRVQRSRHADNHTIYIHAGNCVTEFHPFSLETQTLMRASPALFEKRLAILEKATRELKRMYKEYKEEQKAGKLA